MKNHLITIILLSIGALLIAPSVLANDGLAGPLMPGRIDGIGTHFEITDSEYLNVSLQSTKEITITLESIPKTISLQIEVSTSTDSTTLIIGGLKPNTAYSKFEDSYKNEAVFVSDEQGNHSWTQDLSQAHHIWFQPGENGTVFLPEECSNYGDWNEFTSTCTLIQDLTERVEITANNITLDCNDHSVAGISTGYGVYLKNKEGITIKKCIVTNFTYGIYLGYSSNNSLSNNTTSNHYSGILIDDWSNGNTVKNNTVNFNRGDGIHLSDWSNNNIIDSNTTDLNGIGIAISRSFYNTLAANSVGLNDRYGIYISSSDSNNAYNNNLLANNTANLEYGGGIFISFSNTNKIYHNNFIDNYSYQARVVDEASNLFDNGYPEGGNYWSDYDMPAEGCDDANNDGICDTPYTFPGGQDRYPWIIQNGWVEKTLPEKAADLAKELVNSAYLYGGKGWDYDISEFIAPDTIKNGYIYWNQALATTTFGAGVDCSGLIMWAYDRSFDPTKSRFNNFVKAEGADEQYRYNTTSTTESELKPGDVMFFDNVPKDNFIDHVAMYVGGSGGFDVVNAVDPVSGIIHASSTALKQLPKFVTFKQVVSAPQPAMIVSAYSPVDLVVTDPDGFTITPTTIVNSDLEYLREIPGVLYYSEMEKGMDGSPIDQVYSYTSKTGDYIIKVLPASGAPPTAAYTLDFMAGNQSITLAQNVPVSQIPINGYGITMSATGTISSFIPVTIDIKPGSYPNSINLKSKGTIPVAVLTNQFFNAKDIVIDSVTFAGAKPTKGKLEDVDKDGDSDLILHFNTQSLQISLTSTEAVLTGQLTNGNLIKGTDSVRIVQGVAQQTIFAKILSYINQLIQNLASAIGSAAIR